MMKLIVVLFALVSFCHSLPTWSESIQEAQKFDGSIWAVLVAGSNEYYNYRHQADIYHAYQVLKGHGIPESHIIVFHYDDIANSDENPTKGIVINKPNGKDVYHGVPKDYVGDDVNSANFLKVLQGDSQLKKQGKKVLESGPNDHVFVYFADHGAPGLIAFPNDYLYATPLNKVLKKIAQEKRFSKLVFYLEACESGSMFDKILPKNINIFATTAANPTESSYACYYDDVRQTYLGDVYSVKWIENSDKPNLNSESLTKQFQVVKKETTTSHVHEYGDLSIGKLPLSQFQGAKVAKENDVDVSSPIDDAVASGDVPVGVLLKKYFNAKSEDKDQALAALHAVVDKRNELVTHIVNIVKNLDKDEEIVDTVLNRKNQLHNHQCYEQYVDAFNKNCYNINKNWYAMRQLYVFANLCQVDPENVATNVEKMVKYCNAQVSNSVRII